MRGLSVRDVETILAEALGDPAAVSKSTGSAICQASKDEYEAWAHRHLDEITVGYLFLDPSFFRMHPGFPAERFRLEFHTCLTARADELTEFADAVLCADSPVRNLSSLPLPRTGG